LRLLFWAIVRTRCAQGHVRECLTHNSGDKSFKGDSGWQTYECYFAPAPVHVCTKVAVERASSFFDNKISLCRNTTDT
jgi:hypothetical protein